MPLAVNLSADHVNICIPYIATTMLSAIDLLCIEARHTTIRTSADLLSELLRFITGRNEV